MTQLPPLSEVERLRKKYSLTQTELAKMANVSQSLIARVEANTVDPRYSKVVEIFRSLDSLKGKEIEAHTIMTEDVVGIQEDASLEYAADKMKEYNVSQMPVFSDEKIVGAFTEKVVLSLLSKGYDTKNLAKEQVKQHMEDAFPTIKANTPLYVVSTLLEHAAAVLVVDHGQNSGIITKADLLKVLHH